MFGQHHSLARNVRYGMIVAVSALPAFTVFDVETTGLDPLRGDRIIEIAGVRVENGNILEDTAFVEFINPERAISWEAKNVNKIDESELRNAPTIDQVLPKFLQFADSSILVAHNADFDMGFLESEKRFCWGYIDLPECLCTMRLSKAVFPREFRHNLDSVATRLNLPYQRSRHRALPDVLLTAGALVKMLHIGGITSLDVLREKAGWRKLVA